MEFYLIHVHSTLTNLDTCTYTMKIPPLNVFTFDLCVQALDGAINNDIRKRRSLRRETFIS